jgi:DNA-directed RNA polymerase alpha subunit
MSGIALALIEALKYFRSAYEVEECSETKEFYRYNISMFENKLIMLFGGDIEDLDLNERIVNALYGKGVYTINNLTGYTRQEVLDFPNIGEEYVKDIEEAMHRLGVKFASKKLSNV